MHDIGLLPIWSQRLRLAGEHLVPPSDYMLAKYGVSSRAWLPVLYPYRAATGLWKLLR